MMIRNAWYAAAWDHEVQRLTTKRRILLGEPVVLYRKGDGSAVALEDRCPHRHAQLSQGRLQGDHLVCAYHGLTFASDGRCVHIPSQDTIPETAKVTAYPVVERHHLIWIWMGDPALADLDLVPDFSLLDHPKWDWRGELLSVSGNYLLVIENLMDLTHLPALHVTTLASTAIPENDIPVEYQLDDTGIEVKRWQENCPAPPYFKIIGGLDKSDLVDRWMHVRLTPPSTIKLDIGVAPAGGQARRGDFSQAINTANFNAITPETETTCHYFWAQAQDCAKGDASISEMDFNLVHKAFQEDLSIIAGQQENMALDGGAPRLDLGSDRAGVQARRLIERLAAGEAVKD